jgi:hypothetical protein
MNYLRFVATVCRSMGVTRVISMRICSNFICSGLLISLRPDKVRDALHFIPVAGTFEGCLVERRVYV